MADDRRPVGLISERELGLLAQFGLGEDDAADWQARALTAEHFDDWLTDRLARRPAGRRAREVYGADDVHDFARTAILSALRLAAGDRLLEVGCGGGLLLREALGSGASVTGIDHSEEMVRLATERAPGADVSLAEAEQLPFPNRAFTAVAMSVVFFFLITPELALAEARRVLTDGGRIAVYTTSVTLRGTPAAPEPLASRSRFYTDSELAGLATEAGFRDAKVDEQDGGQLLTATVQDAAAAA
jgi:SAM-dependent methyltransferase